MREFAQKYFELLTTEFSGINLTRILDFEDFYHKQILDSALPAQQSILLNNCLKDGVTPFVDIGFGGGFPLLVLAHLFPNKEFIGFEARGKKAKAVQELSQALGLKNVRALHYRLDDVLLDIPVNLSFKAVGPVDRCLSWIKCSAPIQTFFYKGPAFDEIERPLLVNFKNWIINEELNVSIPQTDKRLLIGIKQENVPRGTFTNLVKVSEII